jgi:hypothetical protein
MRSMVIPRRHHDNTERPDDLATPEVSQEAPG